GDGETGEQGLQVLGDLLRRETERTGAILIHHQADGLHLLAPVEMRIDDLAVRRHDVTHLIGNAAHRHRVRPDHPELHREADRPNTNRSTRERASGTAPSAIACSSRALTRSRASRSLVTITIWAKFGLGSTGLSPSQKRGEPCPT